MNNQNYNNSNFNRSGNSGGNGGNWLTYLLVIIALFFGWKWYTNNYEPSQNQENKQEISSLKNKSDKLSSSELVGVDPNKSYQDKDLQSNQSGSNSNSNLLKDENLLSYKFSINEYPENYKVLDKSLFTEQEISNALVKNNGESWYNLSDLDNLGRSRDAQALITSKTVKETAKMGRPSIPGGKNVPSGYAGNNKRVQLPTYRGYFYNKSHSIAWSLIGSLGGKADPSNEIMNRRNLTTGTRAQNVGNNGRGNDKGPGGMSYTETITRNYLKSKNNGKVLYKVRPVYKDNELVPRGSLVQVKSLDDNGQTIDISVWVFNTQDGAKIDYKTGKFTLNK